MSGILVRVLLPMGLCGALYTLLVHLLRPLLGRLKASAMRAMLLVGAALFLLPMPLLSLPLLAAAPAAGTEPSAAVATLQTAPVTSQLFSAGQTLDAALPPATGPQFSAAVLLHALGWLYVIGVVAALGITALRGSLLLSRLYASCRPATGAKDLALYGSICDDMRLARRPLLYYSDAVSAPMLAGVLRPRVILPGTPLQEEQAAFALRHELTHYRHADLPCKYLMMLVCAVHWYNPAAYLLKRDFTRACEEACDAAVTEALPPPQRKAYANVLLQFSGAPLSGPVFGFGAPARQLKMRLQKLLQPVSSGRGLRTAGAGLCALVLCASLLAGCTLAAGAAGVSDAESNPPLPQSNVSSGVSTSLPASSTVPAEDSSLPDTSPSQTDDDAPAASVPVSDAGFICPVPDVEYFSRGMDSMHRGLDFNAPKGTPVYAIGAGKVLFAGWHYSYGNYIVLLHEGDIRSLYAHCDELFAATGDTVQQGQHIASVGNTGNSAGPHLHLEMSEHLGDEVEQTGGLLNPEDYLVLPDVPHGKPA